jgi:hypothetical protein
VLLTRCRLITLVPYLRLFVSKRPCISLKFIAVLSQFLISLFEYVFAFPCCMTLSFLISRVRYAVSITNSLKSLVTPKFGLVGLLSNFSQAWVAEGNLEKITGSVTIISSWTQSISVAFVEFQDVSVLLSSHIDSESTFSQPTFKLIQCH